MDIPTLLSLTGIMTGLIALITNMVARAQSVSRETIKDLQDQLHALKARVRELEAQGQRDRAEIHELMIEVVDCHKREDGLKIRVMALEAAR